MKNYFKIFHFFNRRKIFPYFFYFFPNKKILLQNTDKRKKTETFIINRVESFQKFCEISKNFKAQLINQLIK